MTHGCYEMEFFRVSAIVPGVKVEDTAVMLAELFLQHLEESDRVIQPNDTVEELIGWGQSQSQ